MRLLSRENLYEELRRRGCVNTGDALDGLGTLWRNAEGKTFTVPEPEERGERYPDWILDDLIKQFRLPTAPA